MATSQVLVLLVVLSSCAFLVSSVSLSEAPSSEPSSSMGDECMNLVISELMPCLEYAQQGSNVTKPSKDCCKGLASFVKKDPSCICTLLGQASDLADSVGVDVARVMKIPSLCKIDAKLDQCKTGTAGSPLPAEGSSAAPSGPHVPGGATAPPPASRASTIWVSSGALVAALTATAFATL